MANIGIGLLLMCVGMISVFVILLIVIYGSELLIKLVNKLSPELEVKPQSASADALTVSILEAAVAQISGGKGIITNITKL